MTMILQIEKKLIRATTTTTTTTTKKKKKKKKKKKENASKPFYEIFQPATTVKVV